MARHATGTFVNTVAIEAIGLSAEMLRAAIEHTYNLLDRIDGTLISVGADPLSMTVELANLSSMLGNIFGAAIAAHSNGLIKRNGPHKFPDLLPAQNSHCPPIEIKFALETNKPKGHLAKPGWYITARYVLCLNGGTYVPGDRGPTAYIWELRLGLLSDAHFNISNTDGDSGKTAVINRAGMESLQVIYVDLDRAPVGKRTRHIYESLIGGKVSRSQVVPEQ